MGMEVNDRNLLSLAQAQYQASSTIYGSSNPAEILDAVINFGGRPFAAALMGLIDAESQLLNVIAVRDQAGIHNASYQQRLDEYPASEMLVAVEVLNIPDATNEPFLTDQERALVHALGMEALVIVPLVVSQQLTGMIAFMNPTPVSLSPEILRALRNLGDQIAVVFENQSLLRSTAASLEEVQTLYNINRAMLGAHTALDVLRVLRQHLARDAAAVTHAVVEHTAEGGERLTVRQAITAQGEAEINQSLDVSAEALNTADTSENRLSPDSTSVIFTEDSQAAADTIGLRRMLAGANVRSAITFLVYERGQVEELIAVTFDQKQTFDSRVRRLYTAVADQIGVVLQNQRLLVEVQRRADQLQRVALLGQRLQAELQLDAILRVLLDDGMQILNIDRLRVALLNEQKHELRIVARYEQRRRSFELDSGPVLSLDGTYAGKVWETQALLVVDDTRSNAIEGVTTNEYAVRSLMIAPLRSRDRMLGVVSTGSVRAYAFTEVDQAIFQQMVNQLAVTLENASAFQQSQRVAQNEALINEIATHLQQRSGVEDMLETAITELGLAIGARRGRIRLLAQPQRPESQIPELPGAADGKGRDSSR